MEMQERIEVQERYPDTYFPDPVLEPVWYGRRPTERVDGRFAVIDQKSNHFYNFCTEQYQVIPYEQVIKLVEDAVKDLPEFGNPVITPKLLKETGRIRINATFEDIDFEIRKGDILHPTIDVFSSLDLSQKYNGRFGAFRVVCTNGMTVGEIFSKFSKRHIVSMDPKELMESVKVGMGLFSEQVGLWKNWAEQIVLPEAYEKAWEVLPFSTAEKEKIENLHEAETRLLLPDALKQNQLTVWDFNNVLTQFVSHDVKSELRRVELEPVIARVMENIR